MQCDYGMLFNHHGVSITRLEYSLDGIDHQQLLLHQHVHMTTFSNDNSKQRVCQIMQSIISGVLLCFNSDCDFRGLVTLGAHVPEELW